MKKLSASFFIVAFFYAISSLNAQNKPAVQVLTSGTKTNLRGLSAVNDNVVWVSGNNGTVGKTTNGGKNWKWITVKGFEKSDFRDIEAFDAATAVIMTIAEPAYILRTADGGDTWKVVYENKTKGMFLDAMEFWNEQAGIVVGDPIDGKFFIARTFDGGSTWKEIPSDKLPRADSGEACFAASGTNITALDRDEAVFVSGGLKSRMFWKGQPRTLPIVQGKNTAGANSIAVWDNYKRKGGKHIAIAGGDFEADTSSVNNCFYTNDGGKNWHAPSDPPHGYRSCIEFITKNDLVACGLTGVDFSSDGGKHWSLISKESFNTVQSSKGGSLVYLAGSNGKIGVVAVAGVR